jgi:hypothetical protein
MEVPGAMEEPEDSLSQSYRTYINRESPKIFAFFYWL